MLLAGPLVRPLCFLELCLPAITRQNALHLFHIAIGTAAVGNTHYPFRFCEILFRTVPPAFAMPPVLIVPYLLAVAAHRQKFFIQSNFF